MDAIDPGKTSVFSSSIVQRDVAVTLLCCRPPRQLGLRERNWGGNAGRAASSSNWMFGGEGAYVPDPNAAPDMRLRLNETVHVLDVGLIRHPAHALLDSGARLTHQCCVITNVQDLRS